jgi:hypothetical protein
MLSSLTENDASARATNLSHGIEGQLNAIPFGLFATGLATALGTAAAGLAASGRLRMAGLLQGAAVGVRDARAAAAWAKHPGPEPALIIGSAAAFVALGLGPLATGVFAASFIQIKGFSSVGSVPIEGKVLHVERALREAATALDRAFFVSCVGTILAAVIVLMLWWWRSPQRARRRELSIPERPEGSSWFASLVPFAVAAVLMLEAAPMRRENEMPWPAPTNDQERLLVETRTPALDGSDALERAPVVEVTRAYLALNGRWIEDAALESALSTLRENYLLLHPGGQFSGAIVVVCEPEIRASRLVQALGATLRAGFVEAQFAFVRREVIERPILGTHARNRTTVARATLVEAPDRAAPGAAVVRALETSTYATLAERIVEARRRGKKVALVAGP